MIKYEEFLYNKIKTISKKILIIILGGKNLKLYNIYFPQPRAYSENYIFYDPKNVEVLKKNKNVIRTTKENIKFNNFIEASYSDNGMYSVITAKLSCSRKKEYSVIISCLEDGKNIKDKRLFNKIVKESNLLEVENDEKIIGKKICLCGGKYKVKSELPELEKLFENIDKEKVKVIGSYLYSNDFSDIDIVTYDIDTGWKIKEKAFEEKILVQIVYVEKDEFDNLENLLTFNNTSIVFHNGKYKLGKNFTSSKDLSFNNDSIKIFRNSQVIFKEIRKMKLKGYNYEE